MPKPELVVRCQYGDTEDIRELIHRSFLLYLRRTLANPGRAAASETEAAVPHIR